MKKWLLILLCFVMGFGPFRELAAQSNSNQVWLEYMGNMAFGKLGNVEGAFTYSSDMGQPKWRTFDVQLTPEWALNKRIDVMGALLLSNTFQTTALSTFEIREMVGARIHLTPNQRLLLRMLLRFEQRNVEDRENRTWEHSTRSRIRLESIYPFNQRRIGASGKVWYGIADVEAFVNFSKDVQERFANRWRFRAGVGYKFNHAFRVEFVYTLQSSVNALEGGMSSRENIFRFRIKHYLKKRSSGNPEGTGN
jgi:hypothetical protein